MAQGRHQEDTMPAKFAQIFEEHFLQSLGERNSSEEKLNEISSRFMEIKFPPLLVNANPHVQGMPAPRNQSSVSSQIPPISEKPSG